MMYNLAMGSIYDQSSLKPTLRIEDFGVNYSLLPLQNNLVEGFTKKQKTEIWFLYCCWIMQFSFLGMKPFFPPFEKLIV